LSEAPSGGTGWTGGRRSKCRGLSRSWLAAWLAVVAALPPSVAASQERAPTALLRGHAHNDYEHPRPLLDALSLGYNSIEADVHLVGDDLLVAHDLEDVDSARSLEALYLAPLRERIRRNGGVVHAQAPPLLLLIDIKGDAEATYARLHPLLRRYADILTITAGDLVVEGPVVAVLSGNRPRTALLAAPVRFASFDGRLPDLEENAQLSPSFMPLVSEDWRRVSDWTGDEAPPPQLRARLDELAARAHAQRRRLRLWGTPDRPEVWRLLRDAGVDLINTDDLAGLRDFLQPDEADDL
jgi:hypothetical protein